jgi:hypothetical protein
MTFVNVSDYFTMFYTVKVATHVTASLTSMHDQSFCTSTIEHLHDNFVQILPVALGPGVYSASNRNEYRKHKNNVSGE